MSRNDRNEANTRKELIDKALQTAGWNLEDPNQVGIEIPVDGYDAEPWNGVTDYCLYQPNGEVIAVVEAKRQSRDPRVAEQQVRDYVTKIEEHQSFRPFAFMSNGDMTFFWDMGNENKRQVAGFFSLRDLQNLLYIRQHKIRLQQLSVNLAIANRTYQQEAIQRVSERFDDNQESLDCQQVIQGLRQQIGQIPLDAFSVQQVYSQVEEAWQDSFWRYLTGHKIDFLRNKVAPLLRFVAGVEVAAATFTNKVERLKLEIVTGDVKAGTVESIAEDVSYLPDFVYQDSQCRGSMDICLSSQLRMATPQHLNRIIADLAGQMKNRRSRPNSFVEIDLRDRIAVSGLISSSKNLE